MSSTINGNVGGSAVSGAVVAATNQRTGVTVYAAADVNGAYSITGLAQGKYRIQASFNAKQYWPGGKSLEVDGSSTYSDVNLVPIALNASNAPVDGRV